MPLFGRRSMNDKRQFPHLPMPRSWFFVHTSSFIVHNFHPNYAKATSLCFSRHKACCCWPFLSVRSQKIVKNEAYYEAVSRYIYAFTSGSISRDDVVRVRFVNAAISQEQVGKEVPASVFSTDPKIEGKAVWEDDRTIKLTPAQPLTPGKTTPPGCLFNGFMRRRPTWPGHSNT